MNAVYPDAIGAVRAACALQVDTGAAALIVAAWMPGDTAASYRVYQQPHLATIVAALDTQCLVTFAYEIGADGRFYDDCPLSYGPYLQTLATAACVTRLALPLHCRQLVPLCADDAPFDYTKQARLADAEIARRGCDALVTAALADVVHIN